MAAPLPIQCVECFASSLQSSEGLPNSESPAFVFFASLSIRGGTRASVSGSLPRRAVSDEATSCTFTQPLLVDDSARLCTEEEWRGDSTGNLFSALQRSMLENQWNLLFDERAHCSVSEREDSEEITWTSNEPNEFVGVVSSGRPSARRRRLEARLQRLSKSNGGASSQPTHSTETMTWQEPALTSESGPGRQRKQAIMKLYHVQGFVSAYLSQASSCNFLTKEEESALSRQFRVGQSLLKTRRMLLEELGHEPSYRIWSQVLQISTSDLVTKLTEGERARDKMILANRGLVIYIAKRYLHRGLDMDDLIQEGLRGLLRGLEKFDPARGCKLSTYLHYWIRQGMTRAIAQRSKLVHVPVHLQDTLSRIRKAEREMIAEGKTVSIEELSYALNISCTRIKNALMANYRILSLDKTICSRHFNEGRSFTLHHIIADTKLENQPWAMFEENCLKEVVRSRWENLTPKEQNAIQLYYRFDSKEGSGLTWTTICQRLGLSKQMVRRLKNAALQKLRQD